MTTRFLTIILFALSGCMAMRGLAQPARVDSLQKIVAQHRGDTTEVNALDGLISEFSRRDLDMAKRYALMQRSLSTKLQSQKGLTSAYAALVVTYLHAGKTDSSKYYLKEFEVFAKSSGNQKAAAEYANSAGLFYRNIGRPREALPFLLDALKMLGPDGDKTRRAGQLLNVGNAYQSMSDFENSSKYYTQSLVLFEEVGNKRGQAFCMQGLGNTYKDLQRYDLAEKYYLATEKLKMELGEKRSLLSTWMSLGTLFQDMKQYDRSLQYATKGLAASREQAVYSEEMKFLYNMGSLMKSLKKPDEARKHYRASMKMAREFGDSVLMSRIKTDLIMLDADVREINDEQSMIRHVEIAIENGDRAVTAEGRLKLADWYSRHGQHDKAYEQIKIAYVLMDSLRGADIQMQIKKIEEEYLGEKKDREIALLRKDQELRSAELSRQNILITAILIAMFSVVVIGMLLINRYRVVNNSRRALEIERVRNNIARDLHDEMGSALSSINILSKVAMVEGETLSRQYLQNIGDQSEKMMENMGDMVWSINPRNDSIEKIIARMREFATEILDAKSIDYVFTEDLPANVAISTDKRKNLFMIFKEAVNNAAKYSAATGMEISLVAENGSLVLTVKDNGKGFEERAAGTGNGLRNMRERAAESAGTLFVKTASGIGTEIQLRIGIA